MPERFIGQFFISSARNNDRYIPLLLLFIVIGWLMYGGLDPSRNFERFPRIPTNQFVRCLALLHGSSHIELTHTVIGGLLRELRCAQEMLTNSARVYNNNVQPLMECMSQFPTKNRSRAPHGEKKGSGKPKPHVKNRSRGAGRNSRSNSVVPDDRSSPANPGDVWLISARLFDSVPSALEIDQICGPMNDTGPVIRWGVGAARDGAPVAVVARKETGDVSDYWKWRVAPFQVETVQRKDENLVNGLLNALVATTPTPAVEREGGDAKSGAPVHALLPLLDFDEYLCHPFEERLEYELSSAGLEKPNDEVKWEGGIYHEEISMFRDELKSIEPMIEKQRVDILADLPRLRGIEQKRAESERQYLACRKRLKMKEHRKRK